MQKYVDIVLWGINLESCDSSRGPTCPVAKQYADFIHVAEERKKKKKLVSSFEV